MKGMRPAIAPAAAGAGRWSRLAPPPAAALGAAALILLALAIVLSALTHGLSVLGTGPEIPIVLAYSGVGVMVAWRQPRNPIGWILLVFIAVFLFSTVAGLYAVLYYNVGHHGLPLAPMAVLLQPSWAPALLLFPVVILIFPDGRLPSQRWRWVLWAYLVGGACACWAVYAPAVAAVAGHSVRLDPFGDVISKSHAAGGLAVAEAVGLALLVAILLSFVGRQVLSWRRAAGERRQQLKWLASGAAVTVILTVVSFWFSSASASGEVLGMGLGALPVGIGVGILKYRLYEIDRIISRSLAYAIVTGLLVGLYAGLVLLATRVLSFHAPVAVAASTLVAAALFSPLRTRVQRMVDRRFNRARYDADQMIAAFAGRLKDSVDLDAVCGDLAGAVQQALEPRHVSVWLKDLDVTGLSPR